MEKIGRHIRVGQYPPNAWGFHDMHGNVGERVFGMLCYSEQGEIDPIGPSSGDREKIIRGGYYTVIK